MTQGDLAALGAVMALLVLPSVVLVRAPWCLAPSLAAALWIVTSAWMGLAGGARERLLHVALGATLALALVRALPKRGTDAARYAGRHPPDRGERTRAAVVITTFALARLAPLALWPLPPGTDGGFRAATALLTAWHDGPPVTLEPLYPVRGVGIDGAGLLAADVLLLSHGTADRALLVVALVGEGLLALAVYAALTRLGRLSWGAAAGVAALVVTAAAPWPGEWASAVLVIAFATAAVSAVATGSGRAAPVAAGILAGAALLTDPLAAGISLVALFAVAAALVPRSSSNGQGLARARLSLACAATVVSALPALLRSPLRNPDALAVTLVGVAAVAAGLGAARFGRSEGPGAPSQWVRLTMPTLIGAAIVTAAVWSASGERVVMSGDRRRSWRAAADGLRVLDRFCLPPGAEGAWVPALTGRGTEPAVLPAGVRATGHPCVPSPP